MAKKMEYRKSAKEVEIEKKVSIPQIFKDFIVPEIPDYYSTYPADFNGTPVVCCPLHDEDTPSMRWYEETNSFYCFGCGKGGNPARLYRLFYNRMRDANISQAAAVDFLYKYYIEGKEVTALPSATQKIESKNSNVDIIRFNKYRVDIEELISFDKSITQEQKEQIWELLDNTDVLVTKNLLDVNECGNYLRNKINEILTVKSTS